MAQKNKSKKASGYYCNCEVPNPKIRKLKHGIYICPICLQFYRAELQLKPVKQKTDEK